MNSDILFARIFLKILLQLALQWEISVSRKKLVTLSTLITILIFCQLNELDKTFNYKHLTSQA